MWKLEENTLSINKRTNIVFFISWFITVINISCLRSSNSRISLICWMNAFFWICKSKIQKCKYTNTKTDMEITNPNSQTLLPDVLVFFCQSCCFSCHRCHSYCFLCCRCLKLMISMLRIITTTWWWWGWWWRWWQC